MTSMAESPIVVRRVTRVVDGRVRRRDESLSVESPLEIRLCADGDDRVLTVTMRTPGRDAELALGFLIAEGVILRASQVRALQPCHSNPNVLRVYLQAGVAPRLASVERNFASTGSCGLCGKASLEAVLASVPTQRLTVAGPRVAGAQLHGIPARLRAAQNVFDRTGGLHAVAAFSFQCELIAAYEDIGRHNAFDKLVGAMLNAGAPDLGERIIALSGRAGFELLQKAAVVRAPVVVAIGAPSSLAVELAERAGITLVGFLREESYNIYTHPERIVLQPLAEAGLSQTAEVA